MAILSPITRKLEWHRYEAKTLDITVTDAAGLPVSLVVGELRWFLLTQAGGRVLLTKESGSGLTVVSTNVARITISEADYASIPAGVYHHELWNKQLPLKLAYGDAWILGGTDPTPA